MKQRDKKSRLQQRHYGEWSNHSLFDHLPIEAQYLWLILRHLLLRPPGIHEGAGAEASDGHGAYGVGCPPAFHRSAAR